MVPTALLSFLFFFNDTATTEIYTLSLHDALPIWQREAGPGSHAAQASDRGPMMGEMKVVAVSLDRKSTRLNSSHQIISYAVFCLKKKNPLESVDQRPDGPHDEGISRSDTTR